jgi:pSer/pThr/pTyr-binding forkhead associated (FHA) protein
MSLLQAKLTQLEARLQSLIEGSAARLVTYRSEPDELPRRLVAAMRAGIKPDGEGKYLAPNLFTLMVHPASAQNLRDNQALLQELARIIHQTGLEAGLRFDMPPFIKVTTDPELAPQQVGIQAQISAEQVDDTSTMLFGTGEETGSIPENAFLIVGGRQVFPLSQAVVNIGRRPDNHLAIDDLRISRVHAQLRAIKGRFVIFDLDSTGGTFVNGERTQQSSLYPGDVISLAGFNLVFGQDTSALSGSTQDSTHPFEPAA